MALSLAAPAPPAKRVDFVSVKLVKEGSTTYPQRFLNNPRDAAFFVREFLEDLDREAVLVLCLDTKHQPTSINTVSIGTLFNSLVHPREVFKAAILSNSASVIICHNHPSGIPEPSQDDIKITERLSEAGEVLGIDVLDHIIIGHDKTYTSFRERGLM